MSRPRKRVQLMPAIREESNLNTKRIPVHIIPPGAKPMGPLKGSMIIQNLPGEPKKPPPKVTPGNRYHDNVQQVVADYLHFSRYGEVLPVTQGFAPSACPCCMDRNRQNLHLLKERNRAPPPEPDPDTLPPPRGAPPQPPDQDKPEGAGLPVPDGRDVRVPVEAGRGFPASWMDFQPTPYAQTYLNSEFNRASLVQGYEQDRRQYEDASMAYVSGRVLDASTKYDLAMKKLERSLNNFTVSDREDRQATADELELGRYSEYDY